MESFPSPLNLKAATADSLRLIGELNFQAGAEGDDATPSTFELLANTGDAMPGSCMGFRDPVIVDLSGARFAKAVTPVIADHDTSKRIGHTTQQTVGDKIVACGVVSSSSADAVGFASDARAGFPFEVSLGADVKKLQRVKAGQSVTVNGRQWKGPINVARKTVIRELSVLTLGADGNTSANISASANLEESNMDKKLKAHIESLGLIAEDLTDEQVAKIKASWVNTTKLEANQLLVNGDSEDDEKKKLQARREIEVNEDERVDGIKTAAKQFAVDGLEKVEVDGTEILLASLRARAIRKGWTVNKFELTCFRSAISPSETESQQHSSLGNAPPELAQGAFEVSLLRAVGGIPAMRTNENGENWGLEAWYDEATLEAADRLPRGMDLHYLMDCTIQAAGMSFHGPRNSGSFVDKFYEADNKMKAAGIGTHQLSNILENVAHKAMDTAYQFQGTIWDQLVGTQPLSDFKDHASYRLIVSGGYKKIGPDGVLPQAHMADSKRTLAADTRGQMLIIGRKQMRNDDLGALTDASKALGANAAICLEEEVLNYLMTNRASFTAGGAGDVDIAGLSAAELVFANQVDEVARPILVPPDRMLVGTQDSVTAKQLFGEANLLAVGAGNAAAKDYATNPHVGKYRVIVSPYLNNTAVKLQSNGKALTNQNANQWYLLCDPNRLAGIVVGFLDGNHLPTVKSDAQPFENIGGIRFKIFHDWGIGTGQTKAIVYNAGA